MAVKAATVIGFVIIALIVIIVVADIIMYVKRVGLYSFKAKPAPTASNNSTTKNLKVTKYSTVFYPNGEPDATTGKPKNSTTLNPGISSRLNNNLNAYNTASIQTNPSDWGPATPSS
jgi:hypothetical protein